MTTVEPVAFGWDEAEKAGHALAAFEYIAKRSGNPTQEESQLELDLSLGTIFFTIDKTKVQERVEKLLATNASLRVDPHAYVLIKMDGFTMAAGCFATSWDIGARIDLLEIQRLMSEDILPPLASPDCSLSLCHWQILSIRHFRLIFALCAR